MPTVAFQGERGAFSEKAINLIYQNSGGTPRLINILCDRALLSGFVVEKFTIDEDIIETCATEAIGIYA